MLGGVLILASLVGLTVVSMHQPAPLHDRPALAGRAAALTVMGGSVPPVRLTADPAGGMPRPEPVRPPAPAGGEFRPVPLVQLRQPLPDNEAWLVRTVLLNPEQGTLAEPGGWAAPARKWTAREHWK